jgi:endonuclease G
MVNSFPIRLKLSLIGGILLASVSTSLIAQGQVDRNFGSIHLLLGNPSGATQDPSNTDNFLSIEPQYALSYNKSKSIPNWVSWQLNQRWLGNVPRCKNSAGADDFQPNTTLPAGIPAVQPTDYAGSGFDRGHVVPSGDRTASKVDNCNTFLMTNIMPQSPDINQGPWKTLEEYGQDLVKKQGKELYIIAGGEGTGGMGEKGFISAFKGKKSKLDITVPASSWKIAIVLNKPGTRLEGIDENTRIIAVIMPHKQGNITDKWNEKVDGKPKYITSVDEIEKLTGYDFLSNVDPKIQDVIEAKIDSGI